MTSCGTSSPDTPTEFKVGEESKARRYQLAAQRKLDEKRLMLAAGKPLLGNTWCLSRLASFFQSSSRSRRRTSHGARRDLP